MTELDEVAEAIWLKHGEQLVNYGPNMLKLIVGLNMEGETLTVRDAVIEKLNLRLMLVREV